MHAHKSSDVAAVDSRNLREGGDHSAPHSIDDATVAARYFGSFVDDYHRAFHGTGRDPLHRIINRLFRRKTFEKRTTVVVDLLRRHGIAGKRLLDLGCGSGEVSLLAAGMGASVIGFDIVPGMVALARKQAEAAQLADRVTFEVHDVLQDRLPTVDVTLVVAVVEYYKDPAYVLRPAAAATGELLVVVDTRGPFWRRSLRYALARVKRFRVHYHSPELISNIVRSTGFSEYERVLGHSYTVMAYRRVVPAESR